MTATRLREAAAKLRGFAEDATPGPWESSLIEYRSGGSTWELTHPHVGAGGHALHPMNVVKASDCCWQPHRADAEFIATMHPGVALALAAWLEAEASSREFDRRAVEKRLKIELDPLPVSAEALAVADAVLGEAS